MPLDQQACLNREHKPPTMCVPVRKADREQMLEMYSRKMAWYDSFTNEWDCCGEFGPPEAMDEDFGSPPPEAGQEDSLDDPTQEPLMPFQDVGPQLLTPPTQPEQTRDAECYTIPQFVPLGHPVEAPLPTEGPSTEADLWQQEVWEILVVYYGYTPPLPLPMDIAPTISLVDQKKMAPWKLTMTSASDALMVCRLDASLSKYEVATYLLQHGIPFKTLLPARLAQETPMGPPLPCVLPARLSDTKFSTKDYDSYSNLCTMIV
ncbi:hypothetical protein DXG01_006247 [Tephrocybe rancida]|nr:hypothetical protein DXG01_006247 [Tephrocybe rancida]